MSECWFECSSRGTPAKTKKNWQNQQSVTTNLGQILKRLQSQTGMWHISCLFAAMKLHYHYDYEKHLNAMTTGGTFHHPNKFGAIGCGQCTCASLPARLKNHSSDTTKPGR